MKDWGLDTFVHIHAKPGHDKDGELSEIMELVEALLHVSPWSDNTFPTTHH